MKQTSRSTERYKYNSEKCHKDGCFAEMSTGSFFKKEGYDSVGASIPPEDHGRIPQNLQNQANNPSEKRKCSFSGPCGRLGCLVGKLQPVGSKQVRNTIKVGPSSKEWSSFSDNHKKHLRKKA